MSWTYDASLLSQDTAIGRRYIVRLVLADIDTTDQLLADEEIDYFLSEADDSTRKAAIRACRSILAKYARQADVWIGHTKVSASDRARQFRQLLSELQESTTDFLINIYAGGQEISGKETLEQDTDAVQPRFISGTDDIEGRFNTGTDKFLDGTD